MSSSPVGATTSLSDAIQSVESAQANLSTADQNQTTAQQRFDTAELAKSSADKAESDATTTYNGALDNLIAAAMAAKKPAPTTGSSGTTSIAAAIPGESSTG